tara:strand:+ start:329 stop:508 length:180 start_codon:yes stop_codon:yes gene_type:complete
MASKKRKVAKKRPAVLSIGKAKKTGVRSKTVLSGKGRVSVVRRGGKVAAKSKPRGRRYR